ncbi:hypothetical protein [Zestomonas carbonaria]|uniref:hypothetical protein n=1 Tax=Zestomonas carbonaria TaxID=2762745 RepID=UPI001656C768|nr:hypothetical protein [Pseudomonas carbonaria]
MDVGAGDTGQDAQPSAGEVVGQLAGVQRHDGTVVELKDMSEAELRQLADALEIAGADHHPLGQVIEAIQAEEVLVPAASDQDHIYLVNRELLEHDGERYAFGDQVVIEDETAAAALLALGAIVREGE